ncbi:MAG: acylphosphatase [Clostridium sp.]
MERLSINVTGKVQGVGFRYFCTRLALKHSLVGSAKNLDDGSVQIIAQGPKPNLDSFLSEILKGNRFITVSNHSITNLSVDLSLKKFSIY